MSAGRNPQHDPESSPLGAPKPEGGPATARARRRPLIRTALVLYSALLGAALLWARLAGTSLFYISARAELRGVQPLRDAGLGAAAAVLVILLSQQFTRHSRWGENLARTLGSILGRLSLAECLSLAAASGVAEEAFFRGALQPRVGLLAASLLFSLAHFVPRRELVPWTFFSFAAGLLLGLLFQSTGNLVAPVVAHASINAVNLRLLSLRYAP